MARCLEILKRCQHADARLPYGFNWTRQFARLWENDHPFDTNVVVRPAGAPTGFEYVSSGGQSGSEEPEWPEVNAGEVVDGSITWVAQPISVDSLADRIDTSTWECADAALVIEDEEIQNLAGLQRTAAVLSGGVSGEVYDAVNTVVTEAGHEYIAIVRLSIS